MVRIVVSTSNGTNSLENRVFLLPFAPPLISNPFSPLLRLFGTTYKVCMWTTIELVLYEAWRVFQGENDYSVVLKEGKWQAEMNCIASITKFQRALAKLRNDMNHEIWKMSGRNLSHWLFTPFLLSFSQPLSVLCSWPYLTPLLFSSEIFNEVFLLSLVIFAPH